MLDFVRQFYTKQQGWVIGVILLTHLVAVAVQHSVWAWLPLIVVGIAAYAVSYSKLEWGLALAFLEIFVGGHGHLITVDVAGFAVSIREVIFLAVMCAWLVLWVTKQVKLSLIGFRDLPLGLIGIAVILATIKGVFANDPRAVFDDMNGFLTLLYFLPVASVHWDSTRCRLLLQTLGVSAVWVAIMSLANVYLFTHLPGLVAHDLYTFVRDARLAEVTLLTGGVGIELLGKAPWYFRVFQQSQAIVVVFELLLLSSTFLMWRSVHERLPKFVIGLHILMLSTTLTSLSRSFWIGGLGGCLVVLTFVMFTKPKLMTLLRRHLQLSLSAVVSVLIVYLLVVLPLPPRPDLSESSFYKGTVDNTREVAVSSRWNLLQPMLTQIWTDPVFGSGFGKTVTFISDDPRLRAINPTGEVTTYRFEWGYQDLWLKMGVLGLLAFAWFYVATLIITIKTLLRADQHLWIVVGLTAGLTMLYTTHIFSPYLNHPIGLGFMVFLLPFFQWRQHIFTANATKPLIPAPLAQVKPTAGVVLKEQL